MDTKCRDNENNWYWTRKNAVLLVIFTVISIKCPKVVGAVLVKL